VRPFRLPPPTPLERYQRSGRERWPFRPAVLWWFAGIELAVSAAMVLGLAAAVRGEPPLVAQTAVLFGRPLLLVALGFACGFLATARCEATVRAGVRAAPMNHWDVAQSVSYVGALALILTSPLGSDLRIVGIAVVLVLYQAAMCLRRASVARGLPPEDPATAVFE
jgi:purine-cytosine permease-like protein